MLQALSTAFVNFAVLAAMFVPLERAFPARAQRLLRPGIAIDACFFLGQYLVTLTLALATSSFVARFVHAHLGVRLLAAMPSAVQVVVAIVLGDLLVYVFHRACHRFDVLWRFHEVHHTAEHLDWLAAHREHPLDGIATALCMNLPAIVLGVRLELLAGVAVFRGAWSIFVHSNVRLPLGPLRLLLGAPELHHWHHAKVARTAHNFANLAPWIDVLFGTHHCPEGEETFPLGVERPMARGYFGMLLRAFLPRQNAPESDRLPSPT